MTSDQVPAENKTPDSFFPGFWDGTGWGFGVGVETRGPRRGRYGWSGGQGTNFYVDPDGTVGILLTQVEMGEHMGGMVDRVPGAASAVLSLCLRYPPRHRALADDDQLKAAPTFLDGADLVVEGPGSPTCGTRSVGLDAAGTRSAERLEPGDRDDSVGL